MNDKTFRTFSLEGRTYQNLLSYMINNNNIESPGYTIIRSKFIVTGNMDDEEEMLLKLKFNIKRIKLNSYELETLAYMRNDDRK